MASSDAPEVAMSTEKQVAMAPNGAPEVATSTEKQLALDNPDVISAYPADNTGVVGEISDADKALAQMGYAPVYKRHFSLWSCFSFALSISGLLYVVSSTVMTTFSYPLYAGGGPAAIWCWFVAGLGALCLTYSISEIASAYPTSGALYFTIKYLAPPEWVPIIAWIDGWLNLIGQIAGSASSEYGAAQMLLAAVAIGSDFNYVPTAWHTVLVNIALIIFHALINTLDTAWLNRLAKTYAIFHIAVLVSCCIALLALQQDKHTAAEAFTTVGIDPETGWSPPGFSFLFGFLSVAWTMTDYDATAHIAEEAINPAKIVPVAISSALTFTYVAGFLFNIVLVFCMGDPADILSSPIGQPVAQIYYNVLGKGGAIFFTVAAFFIMNFVCITALQAGSRTIWAFSRDQMLPGSSIWYKIWKRTSTPVLAVWFYSLLCCLINLIALGSSQTIGAVFKLLFNRFERGPWHLGRASVYINSWACAWTAFVSVIFLFPTAMPVTPEGMNYAVVILAFVFLLATSYWFIAGKKYYTGPRTLAHVENGAIIEATAPGILPDPEKVMASGREI